MGDKIHPKSGSEPAPSDENENPEEDNSPESDKQAAEATADRIERLEQERDEARQEATQSYDRFLRVAAEFENYKKRTTREMDALRNYANESLLKDLLTVVDNLERAIDSSQGGNSSDNGIVEGVDMTLKEIVKILDRYQVKPIEAEGEAFDPAYHQAFMTEESDAHPANTVLKTLQKGYTLHDRLLRPSMVVVSRAKNDSSPEASEKAADNA